MTTTHAPGTTAFADMVDADDDLSPEPKQHLKNEYAFLRAASRQTKPVLVTCPRCRS